MGIPNVKRFRPFCPTCNDSYTLMAVLPTNADVDSYLKDAVARHDHKAFQEGKTQQFKVRVGQQKQKKAK
jgi:ribosomal protein L44E